MTSANFLKKFDNGDEFTDDELEDLAQGMHEIETVRDEDHLEDSNEIRYTTYFTTNQRYFAYEWGTWFIGEQAEYFNEQPYEVNPPKQGEKIIYYNVWTRKNGTSNNIQK